MRSTVYVIIYLCLAGCISKKDKSNHDINATPLVYDRENANDLAVIKDERVASYQGLPDIKVVKDYKVPVVKNTVAISNLTSDKSAKYAAEREAEKNRQVDPRESRLNKSRHEKMLQQTSPVFADPADVNSMRRHTRNMKK